MPGHGPVRRVFLSHTSELAEHPDDDTFVDAVKTGGRVGPSDSCDHRHRGGRLAGRPPPGSADAGQAAAGRHALLTPGLARWTGVAAAFGMLTPQVALPLVGLLGAGGRAYRAGSPGPPGRHRGLHHHSEGQSLRIVGVPVLLRWTARQQPDQRHRFPAAARHQPGIDGDRPDHPGHGRVSASSWPGAAGSPSGEPGRRRPRLAWWTAVAATMVGWTPNELCAAIPAIPRRPAGATTGGHPWTAGGRHRPTRTGAVDLLGPHPPDRRHDRHRPPGPTAEPSRASGVP